MTKSNLIAAALLCAVALGVAFSLRSTSHLTAAPAQPPAVKKNAPEVSTADTPGMLLLEREVEIDEDGRQRLRLKLRNVSGKKVRAYTIVASTDNHRSMITTRPPLGETFDGDEFEKSIYLDWIPEGGALSVAVAYEDGEVQGEWTAAEMIRQRLAKMAKAKVKDAEGKRQ